MSAGRRQFAILPGGKDLWRLKYDEAEFLVGGRGTGPGDTIRCDFRMHEGYVMEMSKWVQSRKFPFNTNSDGYRYLIVKGLKEVLPALEGEVEGSVLNELKVIDEVVAKQQFYRVFEKNLEALGAEVAALLRKPGGLMEASRMLRGCRAYIGRMKNSFWKSYYEDMFMLQFGHYLPSGAGGSALLSTGSNGDGAEADDWADSLPANLAQMFAEEPPELEWPDDHTSNEGAPYSRDVDELHDLLIPPPPHWDD